MGWTTCFNAPCHKADRFGRWVVDRKKSCDTVYTWTSKDDEGKIVSQGRVLKSAMRGTVWYGAVETTDKNGVKKVFCGVCLTCGKSKDGTEFGYKDMEENMGPFYYDCPEAVLDMLSPTENPSAIEWRKTCRERAKVRKAEAEKAKKIVLPEGITCAYKGGWHVTSPTFRASTFYSGCLFKRIGKFEAIDRFVRKYGTDDQKAAWGVKADDPAQAAVA